MHEKSAVKCSISRLPPSDCTLCDWMGEALLVGHCRMLTCRLLACVVSKIFAVNANGFAVCVFKTISVQKV